MEEEKRTYSPWTIGGFVLAVLAGLAEVLAGAGTRWQWWNYRTGLAILPWAAGGGIAAGVISHGGCVVCRRDRRRGFILAVIGLLAAIVVFAIPWSYRLTARRVPAIHDITTDTQNPPRFVAVLPLRKGLNPAVYGGPEVAAKQHAAYPDIVPLELPLPPDRAFALALGAARSLGWRIVDKNPSEGRIEATDTTFWFGFRDDIVVRVAPFNQGSRIDVRSESRVGKSDLGTNARRIRGYLNKIREME